MVTVCNNKDIFYSIGDTFSLPVYEADEGFFEAGMTARLIIAENEQDAAIISKEYNIIEDASGTFYFDLTLNAEDKAKLPLKNNYIYKIIIYKNNVITTEKSGYFSVIWGA